MSCFTLKAAPGALLPAATGRPQPLGAANACLSCWATSYCALYTPLGGRTPPACPLNPARRIRRTPGKKAR